MQTAEKITEIGESGTVGIDETEPCGTESELPEEELAEQNEESEDTSAEEPVDYAELAKADMRELRSLFPSLRDKTSITELDDPLRYAALRDLGLSPKEAYLATSAGIGAYDNRSHLRSAVSSSRGTSSRAMSESELKGARELFFGLSDKEIQRLYKKVTN
jgi:hypothetical protein